MSQEEKPTGTIIFFAPMIPPTATGQMRKWTVRDGKPRSYAPDRVIDAKEKLLAHMAQHRPDAPLEGAIMLRVQWHFPCGAHTPGTYRTTRPDTDNLQKLLKDILTDLGYWRDDAQVACEVVEKYWAQQPGIFVHVEQLP